MDLKLHTLQNAKRHQATPSHLISVEGRLRLEEEIAAGADDHADHSEPAMAHESFPILQELLNDMANDDSQDFGEFSGTFEDVEGLPFGESKSQLAEVLLGFLNDADYSDNQLEWSEGQREQLAVEEEMIFGENFRKSYWSSLTYLLAGDEVDYEDGDSRYSKRARLDDQQTSNTSKDWFPWPDKIVRKCTTFPGGTLTLFLGMYD